MKTHTYVTKNRLGIYYFQYSYVQVTDNKRSRKLFRKSLRTRNSAEATEMARYLWICMNNIYKKYFKDPELYGRAMKLLSQYEAIDHDNFGDISKFLEELDDLDDHLLELAIKQKEEDYQLEKLKSDQNRLNDLEKKYQFLVEHYSKENITTITQHPENSNNYLIRELVPKWLEYKKSITKSSTFKTYQDQIAIIQKKIEEKLSRNARIMDFSLDVIRDLKDSIRNLPSQRRSSSLKNKNVGEVAQSKDRKISSPIISSATYHAYLNVLIDFVKWGESEGFIKNSSELISPLQFSKKTVKKENSINRVDFDDSDLKKIFLSEQYTKGTFKKASLYWVPLIALFTGARLGEIGQLRLSDIRKSEDDIYYFDINEEEDDKSVKQKSSIRKIPIHDTLIKLDILGYIEELEKKKQSKLFPKEIRDNTKRFHYLQKCLSDYIKRTGIESSPEKTKTFHSFRHTVRTKFVDLEIKEEIIDEILGHSSQGRSIGRKVYTHTDLLQQKNAAMKKLKYDLDFDKIKKWDLNKFRKNEMDLLQIED